MVCFSFQKSCLDGLTKQISPKNKSSLLSLEIITEYNNSITKKVIKTVNVPWYLKVSGFSLVLRNFCKNSKMIQLERDMWPLKMTE